MTAALATLNRAALVALEDCEQRIERGLRTFIEVGAALAAIRDNKLYRGTHETFEAYCRERWNMTPQHANRLALAAGVVTSMEPIGSIQPPTNEGQARALAAAPEAERADVWREAVERTDGKPTAKVIGEVLKERTTPAEPDRKPLGAQSLVPEPIAEHYETSAWKDDTGPGGCGIECACGVTYDGFDTLADAAEHMGRHIETPGPVDADGAPPADPGATPEPAGGQTEHDHDGYCLKAGGECSPEARQAQPEPVTPPPGSPATWTPEQVEANRRQVERRRMRESARRHSRTFVTTILTEIYTVTAGVELGEHGLVTAEMVTQLREAVEHLAQFVEEAE